MNRFIYIFLIVLVASGTLFGKDEIKNDIQNRVDCIILEDENSIICKYMQPRVDFDKTVSFIWIEPNGEITRQKELTIPAGHGSVYDFRYIQGREPGLWHFKVIDGQDEYNTTFTIEQ